MHRATHSRSRVESTSTSVATGGAVATGGGAASAVGRDSRGNRIESPSINLEVSTRSMTRQIVDSSGSAHPLEGSMRRGGSASDRSRKGGEGGGGRGGSSSHGAVQLSSGETALSSPQPEASTGLTVEQVSRG